MLTRFARLSINRRLAVSALALGTGALFASVDRGRALSIHERELATLVQHEVDHLDTATLAGWIIQARSDYRLLDLRDAAEFAAYHIPTAENIPVASLEEFPLQRNETIVLYSDGGIHAAQAWMLLKAAGYRGVVTLRGGLEGWKDEVLFPVLPDQPTPQQQARLEHTLSVASFFGGRPRQGVGTEAVSLKAPELPKLEAPALPGGAAAAPKRKKKEGC